MSIHVMSSVWRDAQCDGGTLLVLLAMADFCDDGGTCYPAVGTLAKKARLSERQARYILRDLESADILATEIGTGPKGTNRYQLSIPNLSNPIQSRAFELKRSEAVPGEAARSENENANRHSTVSKPPLGGVLTVNDGSGAVGCRGRGGNLQQGAISAGGSGVQGGSDTSGGSGLPGAGDKMPQYRPCSCAPRDPQPQRWINPQTGYEHTDCRRCGDPILKPVASGLGSQNPMTETVLEVAEAVSMPKVTSPGHMNSVAELKRQAEVLKGGE